MADSLRDEGNSPVQRRDTLKPVKLEDGQALIVDSAHMIRIGYEPIQQPLIMYFAYDEQHRFLPGLKMYAIYNGYDYIDHQEGFYDFCAVQNSAYSFSDTLIVTGGAEGEMGSSILTVWKKEGAKYRFISALEKSLVNYAHVDSVINLGKNKYLLAGMTEWGDAGDGAGSIWFAVWELPGSFRMIYYDKWFVGFNEDKQYSYNYSVKNNSISLEKLVVNYKTSEHYPKIHTDWKVTKTIINIDLSSTIDKTADFNSYEDVGE